MAISHTLKDQGRETRLFFNRSLIAAFVSLLLLLGLVLRLVFLQVANHDLYTTLSQDNRVRIEPLAPTRGLIYDRNGVLLAENLPSFSIEITPERVKDMTTTLKELSGVIQIDDADIDQFLKRLKRKRDFEGVPLRLRLEEEEVARFAVNRHRFPGVDITSRLVRNYPLGELTAHVVGYVGRINTDESKLLSEAEYRSLSYIGKIGIEKYYEELLRGELGLQRVETNAEARVLRVLEKQPATPGADLYLSIDMRLQEAARTAMGEEKGAVVAIDPNNGEVLAMISTPSYDPNLFVNGIDQETYNLLRNAKDRPLFNRVIRGQYPPGSTLKPFIGLTGLESEEVDYRESVPCDGYYLLENDERRYRDWKKDGHGETDLDRALVESCDVYFYDLGLRLGIDKISAGLAPFGFGSPTGVDLASEMRGLLPSREWKRQSKHMPWFPGETLITAIGQGFALATPLQLATATAFLSRNGIRMRPQVLSAIHRHGELEREMQHRSPLEPIPIKKAIHWQQVVQSMRRVVHSPRGTARRLAPGLDYQMAGKTGTAQVFGIKQDEEYVQEDIEKHLRDHALFIGFAPVKKPEIAVAVIVENGGSGGAVAGPIARAVIERYMAGRKP